jgi:hypothetical protein
LFNAGFDAGAAVPTPAAAPDPDAIARSFAVEPDNNVVLEASAGTGKTSVLVARYVNLLKRAWIRPISSLSPREKPPPRCAPDRPRLARPVRAERSIEAADL